MQFAEMGFLNNQKIPLGRILIIGFLFKVGCEYENSVTQPLSESLFLEKNVMLRL